MATVRYLVRDVDEAIPFYEALGFEVSERWVPPFSMVTRGDLTVWLSGPGSSAAKALPGGRRPEPGIHKRRRSDIERAVVMDSGSRAARPE